MDFGQKKPKEDLCRLDLQINCEVNEKSRNLEIKRDFFNLNMTHG